MAIPAGIIVGWPSTNGSIPAGWDRVSGLDLKFPKGTTDEISAPVTEDFEDTSYNVTITNGGFAFWARDNTVSHGGSWSLKSGNIPDDALSWVEVTVPAGAGKLGFWYKVSSELGFDTFEVWNDHVLLVQTSGEVDWTYAEVDVTGQTSIYFYYEKDVSDEAGSDAAWIDDLAFTFEEGGSDTHSHSTNGHRHALDHSHPAGGVSSSFNSTDATRASGGVSTTADTHNHNIPALPSVAVNSEITFPSAIQQQSNNPAHMIVIYIESDGTPTEFPTGALVYWSSTTLPSGKSLYENSKNRFMRGATAAGDGGSTDAGNINHNHTINSHTHAGSVHDHSASETSGSNNQTVSYAGGSASTFLQNHTHTINPSGTTTGSLAAASGGTSSTDNFNEPPYIKLGVFDAALVEEIQGIICMWLGTVAGIPAGWFLCDGTNGTPDLTDKYVKGANTAGEIGSTGGSTTGHTHTGGVHTHTTSGHTHNMSLASTTASGQNSTAGAVNIAAGSHTHSGTSASATPTVQNSTAYILETTSTEPAHRRVHFIMQGPVTVEAAASASGAGSLAASADVLAAGTSAGSGFGTLSATAIAFNPYDGPTALVYIETEPDVWVEITNDLIQGSTNRGRQNELDRYGTGTASLVFRNADRKYDPVHAGSPLYGYLDVRHRMKVEVFHGGVTHPVFLGYIDKISENRALSNAHATATIQCSDFFKVMNKAVINGTSFGSELPGERINAVLDLLSVPVGMRDIDDGETVLQAGEYSSTLLTHAQTVAQTEFGDLFVQADGVIRFKSRDAALTEPVQGTFGDAPGEHHYNSLTPQFDDSLIRNPVSVDRNGGIRQTVEDSDLTDPPPVGYGVNHYTLSGTYHNSDADALSTANYLLGRYKLPKRRVVGLGFGPVPYAEGPTTYPLILGLELTQRIMVIERPMGIGSEIRQSSVIEGISHDFSPGKWQTKWNVSPGFASGDFWTLGVSELGSDTVLYF